MSWSKSRSPARDVEGRRSTATTTAKESHGAGMAIVLVLVCASIMAMCPTFLYCCWLL